MSLGGHLLDDRAHHRCHYLGLQLLVHQGSRGVCAHSAGVGALVPIEQRLVVLCCRHRDDGCSVAEGEDGCLLTDEELFDDDFVAGVAKLTVDHDPV